MSTTCAQVYLSVFDAVQGVCKPCTSCAYVADWSLCWDVCRRRSCIGSVDEFVLGLDPLSIGYASVVFGFVFVSVSSCTSLCKVVFFCVRMCFVQHRLEWHVLSCPSRLLCVDFRSVSRTSFGLNLLRVVHSDVFGDLLEVTGPAFSVKLGS